MRAKAVLTQLRNLTLLAMLVTPTGVFAATPITPTNLDDINLGVSVEDPAGKNVIPSNVGTFDAEVFYSTSYTYVFQMNPLVDDVREILSPLYLEGYNGVAGWSFSDASSAGGPSDGTAWALALTSNDSLRWDTPAQEDSSNFFDGSESIRFFYQSIWGPGTLYGNHNIATGTTAGFASGPMPAVPEPATLGLLLLGGLALLRRRK